MDDCERQWEQPEAWEARRERAHRLPAARHRRLSERALVLLGLVFAGGFLFYVLELDVKLGMNAGVAEGMLLAQEGRLSAPHPARPPTFEPAVRLYGPPHLTVLDSRGERVAAFRIVRREVFEAIRDAHEQQVRRPEIEEVPPAYLLPRFRPVAYVRGRVYYAGLGRQVVYGFAR